MIITKKYLLPMVFTTNQNRQQKTMEKSNNSNVNNYRIIIYNIIRII